MLIETEVESQWRLNGDGVRTLHNERRETCRAGSAGNYP